MRQMEERGENLKKTQQRCRNPLQFDQQNIELFQMQQCHSLWALSLLNSKDPHPPKPHSCIKESLDGIWYLLGLNTYLICIPGGKDGRNLETIFLVCLQIFAVLYRYTLAVSCVWGGGGVCCALRFSIWLHYICDFIQWLCVCIFFFFCQVIYQCLKSPNILFLCNGSKK